MKWVTRKFVHVDRTACPWLIKRFVDSNAEFIFAPTERIEEIANQEDAIPYDIPNVELGHHGEKCSFEAIVEKYGINDPAVLDLAKIIRAADSERIETAAEAAGLEAIMSGLSIGAKDDHEAIQKAAPVYDALYTNCKLKIIQGLYKKEIEEMEQTKRRDFLKNKLNG
jgi:hypothetical protein